MLMLLLRERVRVERRRGEGAAACMVVVGPTAYAELAAAALAPLRLLAVPFFPRVEVTVVQSVAECVVAVAPA